MPKKARGHLYQYSYKAAYQANNFSKTATASSSSSPAAAGAASSSKGQTSTATTAGAENSVNEELQRLRKTRLFIPGQDEVPSEGSVARAAARLMPPSRTTHPSLRGILQDGGALYVPPRPRFQRGHDAPDSWRAASQRREIRDETPESNSVADFTGSPSGAVIHPTLTSDDDISLVPGLRLRRTSMLYTILSGMANNWDFHVEYDRDYLWMLRGGLKSMLLAFIAWRTVTAEGGSNLEGGNSVLTAQTLRILFERERENKLDGEGNAIEDTTTTTIMEPVGMEEIWHMDLSGALGRGLDFKDLNTLFRPHSTGGPSSTTPPKSKTSASSTPPQSTQKVYNSWEEELEATDVSSLSMSPSVTPIPAQLSTTMFPNLTHLSLAYPKNHESLFNGLQKFASKYVPTITHLSLAGWQTSISSNSGLASRQVVLEHFASVFRRLSRSLICLQYLDVSDCNRVVFQSLQGVEEWNGCWRGVTTVVACQSALRDDEKICEIAEIQALRIAEVAALEETVRKQRRDGKGIWCRFVTGRRVAGTSV